MTKGPVPALYECVNSSSFCRFSSSQSTSGPLKYFLTNIHEKHKIIAIAPITTQTLRYKQESAEETIIILRDVTIHFSVIQYVNAQRNGRLTSSLCRQLLE